jgi:hypothetical protein
MIVASQKKLERGVAAMHPMHESLHRTRRAFLTTTASGLGMAALGAMLTEDGLISPATAGPAEVNAVNPLAPKRPHFVHLHLYGRGALADRFV